MSGIEVTPEELQAGLNIATGKEHTLVLKRRKAVIVEVDDLNFHTGSAVMLPAPHQVGGRKQGLIGGLNCIIRAFEYGLERGHTLLVAGHTDTDGGDSTNLELSRRRAENVRLFLVGDKDGWAAACANHKVQDYQTILQWVSEEYGWNCHPGGIDGQHGSRTTAALESFRKRYRASYGELPDSKRLTKSDWMAFYHLYELYVTRSVDLAGARSGLQLADPPILACGEHWPLEGLGKNNFRSQLNRRVELIFFEQPPPDMSSQKPPGAQLFGSRLFFQRSYLPIEGLRRFYFSV